MNLILSRKGFDSGTGGFPSPILPDGSLYSFPIPDKNPHRHATRYRDLQHPTLNPAKLLRDLTGNKISPNAKAHLDPDLDPTSINRLSGWKPAFGQANASERHLRNQNVGPGDLFLFFGWFRQVELYRRKYRYVKTAPDIHVIFGWLQIAEHIDMHQHQALPDWLHQHPHIQAHPTATPNGIYIASPKLTLPTSQSPSKLPGGGLFSHYHPSLQLTVSGQQRSQWQLPNWFCPEGTEPQLTYHRDPKRWQRQDNHVLLKTVGRGQEFVTPIHQPQQLSTWLKSLFSTQ